MSSHLKLCLWILLPVFLLSTECWAGNKESKGSKSPVIGSKSPKGGKSPMIADKGSKGSKSPVVRSKAPKGDKFPVIADKELKGSKSSTVAEKENKGRKSAVTADEGLIFTNILFRHGERNIIRSYPTDPWRQEKNPRLWVGGYGAITKAGEQQMVDLGKYFGRRYENLLKQGTHPLDLVYVQSSEVSRTKASARNFIDGFFPQTDNQTYNGLKWQPIPINVIPKALDSTIRNSRLCAKYRQKLRYWADFDLFNALKDVTGIVYTTDEDVFDLYDTLNTEKLRGLTLPKWAEERFDEIERVAQLYYKQKTQTKPLARLRCGFLIRDMLDHFNDKIKSKLKQSIWIYSGHDATVFGLLNSLEVLEKLGMHIPTYAATVLFELYKSKDGHYVRLFYKKSTAEVAYPIHIPNCGIKCPLKTFQEVYKDIIPTADFDKECEIPRE